MVRPVGVDSSVERREFKNTRTLQWNTSVGAFDRFSTHHVASMKQSKQRLETKGTLKVPG